MPTSKLQPRRATVLAIALAAALGVAAPLAWAASPPASAEAGIDIAYEQFTLPNGLRVVVHTDRKAPIVAVNLWYHVGSKDEPSGRSGFAHLFEHLMFQASENHDGEYFAPFKQIGVTDQNGTTNTDRTNYFQNVPTTALDTALWMESDRMGHLLGAVDQAALDEQRGVVQNEKRQGENQPYGQAWTRLMKALYPEGHPYSHTVIGSMNDLDAAALEDVHAWFRAWYGPNNAVLVLAGDIDLATAKDKVTKYFGHIPAGPDMAQPQVDVARRAESTREVMEDKVPQPRIYRVWNVAEVGNPDLDRLQLLAQVLGGSRSSRLDARLLHRDQLVDSISAGSYGKQLGSNFMVIANVKQGVDPAKVEAAIDEEIARLLAEGPTAEELERARTMFRAGFTRGIERIGGFGGKADALAECAVYAGDPGCFRESLRIIDTTTAAELQAAGRQWLGKGEHTLVVMPGERTALAEDPAGVPQPWTLPDVDARYATLPVAVDRTQGVPMPTAFPELKFPAVERATLSNGSTVVLARRSGVPVVQLNYQFPAAGYSADAEGRMGTASFAMGMLDEGAAGAGPLAFAERAETLGAQLGAGAALDAGTAWLSALSAKLDASVALFADMLRRPDFDAAELERVRATWIANIAQEKARPQTAALRVLPPLLYGEGHPYAMPFTGSGTEASIAALTRDDLLAFHRASVRPEGATLVVVGDTTLAEIVPLLEKHLGDWRGSGEAPAVAAAIPEVARPDKARVFLIDQPGAVQANIYAGLLVPPTTDSGSVRLDIANGVVGGDFTARLNMNLREDKHWSYGARSGASGALGQRPWLASAPVQIDRTADAMAEIQREIAGFASGKAPPTAAEVERIRAINTLSLPGAYETASSVASTIAGNVMYGRPDDYVARRKAEIEAMTPAQVAEAARTIDADALTWVVVGDLSQIEAPVRALELGEVTVLDADGKPVAR
ncbi:pitrilysin family protein [Luteimonas sp. MC1750]|uniref:M16 family metallopeptidase n=1 Tax=Luteimonas sp. MC1750 TaxID=2799326 RepID=UPI0018F0D726|nr:pitrilysin family protein [Luteimonas sp. MC1750]MBJ6985478.1 insulinase family protein [Luteimonas sp. MC1750]QQO06034.1 insulinase family protein [Luteimonas sp. MC1750]